MAEEHEKRTPVFDFDTGEFLKDPMGRIVTVTEGLAAEQVITKALQTARSKYPIYFDNENPDNDDKYGNEVHGLLTQRNLPESVRLSEIKRAIQEALIYDPWITAVEDIDVRRIGTSEAEADFTVRTIFDDINLEGVSLIG